MLPVSSSCQKLKIGCAGGTWPSSSLGMPPDVRDGVRSSTTRCSLFLLFVTPRNDTFCNFALNPCSTRLGTAPADIPVLLLFPADVPELLLVPPPPPGYSLCSPSTPLYSRLSSGVKSQKCRNAQNGKTVLFRVSTGNDSFNRFDRFKPARSTFLNSFNRYSCSSGSKSWIIPAPPVGKTLLLAP